jgi:hypothetical protein
MVVVRVLGPDCFFGGFHGKMSSGNGPTDSVSTIVTTEILVDT